MDGQHRPEKAMAIAAVRGRTIHRGALTGAARVAPAMEAVAAGAGARQLEAMEGALEPAP